MRMVFEVVFEVENDWDADPDGERPVAGMTMGPFGPAGAATLHATATEAPAERKALIAEVARAMLAAVAMQGAVQAGARAGATIYGVRVGEARWDGWDNAAMRRALAEAAPPTAPRRRRAKGAAS